MYGRLRVLYSTLGSTLSAVDWQSPSIAASMMSQAGSETGSIQKGINDYKRDVHDGEQAFGKAFVKEYVHHQLRLPPIAYPTASGMAAMTVVLSHLRPRVKPTDTIMVGASCYFQTKWQLEQFFPGQVHYIDEHATAKIIEFTRTRQPRIVLLESLCTSDTVAMPNLRVLLPELLRVLDSSSTIVLDNTAMANFYQPLDDLPMSIRGAQFLVVESLVKYHQFGFDRVNAGIVWASSGSEEGLFNARMHTGTIIPNTSLHTLPEPNGVLLQKRLARIGRNTLYLASGLEKVLESSDSLEAIVYPGLPSHVGYAWANDLAFQGGFFVLRFKSKYRKISYYDSFIERLILEAKRRGVDIVEGTSFGFSTTRIYVSARYAGILTEPFVRVAVGTETMDEIQKLAEVFKIVLTDVSFS